MGGSDSIPLVSNPRACQPGATSSDFSPTGSLKRGHVQRPEPKDSAGWSLEPSPGPGSACRPCRRWNWLKPSRGSGQNTQEVLERGARLGVSEAPQKPRTDPLRSAHLSAGAGVSRVSCGDSSAGPAPHGSGCVLTASFAPFSRLIGVLKIRDRYKGRGVVKIIKGVLGGQAWGPPA